MTAASPTDRPYVVITADTHAGASIEAYRAYLEPRWQGEFDAWRALYSNPSKKQALATACKGKDLSNAQNFTAAEALGAKVLEPVFPALSAVLAEAERFSPSPVIALSDGHDPSMPERASAQVHSTLTSLRYQPAPFGLEVGAPLIVGSVLSMLRSLTVALSSLSALSAA